MEDTVDMAVVTAVVMVMADATVVVMEEVVPSQVTDTAVEVIHSMVEVVVHVGVK